MRKFRLMVVFLFISCLAIAQADTVASLNSPNIDLLKNIYRKNKQILNEYETATLIALSHYPELANERIDFKYKSINSTARTTLSTASLFMKTGKQYFIYINNDINKTGILLNEASLQAQVGLIGHELSHVLDFKQKSFLELAWWGIKYSFVKQQGRIEKHADKTTILHGLGWPLYHWAQFALNHPAASGQYLEMKKTRYLLPHQIRDLIYNIYPAP